MFARAAGFASSIVLLVIVACGNSDGGASSEHDARLDSTISDVGFVPSATVLPAAGDIHFTGGDCMNRDCAIVVNEVRVLLGTVSSGTDTMSDTILSSHDVMTGTKSSDASFILNNGAFTLSWTGQDGAPVSQMMIPDGPKVTGSYRADSGLFTFSGRLVSTSGDPPLRLAFDLTGRDTPSGT